MLKKYTPDEFWDLYAKIPPDLQEALFSEHIAKKIDNISERNEINNASLTEIMGYVFLGIIRPERLQDNLEKELKLSPDKAKDIAQEVERFILYPLKNSLASILKIDYKPTLSPSLDTETFSLPKTSTTPETPEISTDIPEKLTEERPEEEKEKEDREKDTYREPLE
jgi:hypothetical protein